MLDRPRRSAALADIPELLYRYQGISDFRNEVDMLERHRLWFASPRTLNDPFECRPHFVFSKNSVMGEEQARIVVANQAPANLSAEEREEYVARLIEAYPQFDGDIDFRNPDTDEWFVSGLLTKSPHWIYEEEWRALRINCRPSYQTFLPGSLKQIILGARMHRRDRRELLAMIEEFPLPIEVLEAREAQGSYAIELHAI